MFVHPDPIEVCYDFVRSLLPTLLFTTCSQDSHPCAFSTHPSQAHPSPTPNPDGSNFDLVVHLGLAPGRNFFSIESIAHRDGYVKLDIHGNNLDGDTFWHDVFGAPLTLQPTLNLPHIWKGWKQALPDEDLRLSNNAGRYLCEFIFYAGMLEYSRRDPTGKRPCIFCHVPPGAEEGDLLRGKEAVQALITTMVKVEIGKVEEKSFGGLEGIEQVQITIDSDGC